MRIQITFQDKEGLISAHPSSYEDLVALVVNQQAYLQLPAKYVLKYLDPDGDYITLNSEEDFKIMKETIKDNSLILQISCGGLNKSDISSLSDLSEEKPAENVLELVSPLEAVSIASPTRYRDAVEFQDLNDRMNETIELTKAMKLPQEDESSECYHFCVSTQKGTESTDMVTQTTAQTNATVAVLAAIEQKNQETDTSTLLEMKPRGVSTTSEEDVIPMPEEGETAKRQMKQLSKSRKLTQADDSSDVSEEGLEQCATTMQERLASCVDSELQKIIPNLVERITKHVKSEVQQQVDAAREIKEKAHAYANKVHEYVYPGVKCDTCGVDMIGVWYRCSVCTDVNFCTKCENSIFHAHAFLKIDHPSKAPTFMTLGQQDRMAEQNRTFWKRASNLFNFVPPHQMESRKQHLQMMANVVKVYPRHIDTTVEKVYVSLQFSNIGLVDWPEEVILSRAGSFLPQDTLRLPALKPGQNTRVTVVIDNVGYVRKLESFWRILFRDMNNAFMLMGNDIPVVVDVKEPFLRTPREIEADEADPFHCAIQRLQELFPERRVVDLVQLLVENPMKPLIEIINDLLA